MADPFPFLQHLDIPPAWEAAARRFLETPGVTMVLGGTDTGKSTLCTYLVYQAYRAGEPVGLLDLDLGQSHLGPPGTLGLNVFPPRLPGDTGLFPEALYFIGRTSPLGAVLEVAVGSRVLADEARTRGIMRLVVNTSGLIHGPAAHRLKLAQMELLRPSLIPALVRGQELAPLLHTTAEAHKTLLVPVSSRARRRSPEERRNYREQRFRDYFQKARILELSLASLVWRGYPFGWGLALAPAELRQWRRRVGTAVWCGTHSPGRVTLLVERLPPEPPGHDAGEVVHLVPLQELAQRLVGLWGAGHRTLALGLLEASPWRDGLLRVLTPLPSARAHEVVALSLGHLRLDNQGRELGHS
jgi:polynucleotide 5'-hydroxyl-kinase GRC3/NOL9